MAMYACDVIGDGTEDNPRRPALADHIEAGYEVHAEHAGSMLVYCRPTPAQHSALVADPRIDWLPE